MIDAEIESAARRIIETCTGRGLTIATAESCTGGLLCHRLTTVSGSSRYVLGGAIAYHNRVKQDVLPGRYTTIWFQATKPGSYHLFCAEYCGKQHSEMRAKVVVHPTAVDPEYYHARYG